MRDCVAAKQRCDLANSWCDSIRIWSYREFPQFGSNPTRRWYEFRGEWCDLGCAQCKQQYDGATAVALGEIGLQRIEGAEEVGEDLLAKMLVNLLGQPRHVEHECRWGYLEASSA